MLFNSIEFVFFLPIVFALYWLIPSRNLRAQNLLILIASYVFYGWWDWKFLLLILFSTVVDYFIALQIEKTPKGKKWWLGVSILSNLGILGVFKYYNFFIENFKEAFQLFGYQFDGWTLNLILPVGISFYTFQTLSYTIDVYRGQLKPTKNFISFSAFVSFFPQLVAGPIERASNLLPQFKRKRIFNRAMAVDGMRQILYGLFKKVVIADRCALVVNPIFENYQAYDGASLLLAVVLFAFQIYGDFSGYSDIAIGVAKLFGFTLMTNFAFPYFSRDIAEFWRRWHISLSTWFRDYLYIPLGGSRLNTLGAIRNIFIIFLVSGFWHGANWTYISWGGLNALYFIPLFIFKLNRRHNGDLEFKNRIHFLKTLPHILITFLITCLAWTFFRSNSVSDALDILGKIANFSSWSSPSLETELLVLLIGFILWEWKHRNRKHGLALSWMKKPFYKWMVYYFILGLIVVYGANQEEFIYFQF
ncbi:MAG: MBOAT family O-acyltransferase [Vicingaceae bacterium]